MITIGFILLIIDLCVLIGFLIWVAGKCVEYSKGAKKNKEENKKLREELKQSREKEDE